MTALVAPLAFTCAETLIPFWGLFNFTFRDHWAIGKYRSAVFRNESDFFPDLAVFLS